MHSEHRFSGSLKEFKKWLIGKIAEETLLRSHVALAKWSKK